MNLQVNLHFTVFREGHTLEMTNCDESKQPNTMSSLSSSHCTSSIRWIYYLKFSVVLMLVSQKEMEEAPTVVLPRIQPKEKKKKR